MKSLSGKPKKCKECGESFVPNKPMQKVCSVACAITHAKTTGEASRKRDQAKQVREARREIKAAKEGLKSRSEWMKEAQASFNAYIRERDKDQPCICCGSYGEEENWLVGGKWDAGHFLSRGAYPELRFEELNCHKQLKSCNAGSSKYAMKGRTVASGYREGLIRKIGLEAVEWLEGSHEPKRYTIDDLKAIKAEYKAKLKELIATR